MGFLYLDPPKIINTYRKNNIKHLNRSIIISYRESSVERRENLKRVIDYLSLLQDGNTEIIIVEQDEDSKIDWLGDVKNNQFIKHIFVQNDGIFNKGWGYNIGAKNAEANILMFSDSDIFIKPQTINIGFMKLGNFDVVNPYHSVVFLDEESSNLFPEHKYSFAIANRSRPIKHTIITGGIFFMKKDTFLNIKGFDEDCYGYGHEDDILDEKIRKLGLSVHNINDISIHIYHEPATDNNSLYYSFIEINKQLFAEYKDLSKEQLKVKLDTITDWGEISNPHARDTSMRHIKRALYEQTSEKIIEYVLSKFTDDYLDEIVNEISTKIYNDIVDVMGEKIKKELSNINYSDTDKKNMLQKVMQKFRL